MFASESNRSVDFSQLASVDPSRNRLRSDDETIFVCCAGCVRSGGNDLVTNEHRHILLTFGKESLKERFLPSKPLRRRHTACPPLVYTASRGKLVRTRGETRETNGFISAAANKVMFVADLYQRKHRFVAIVRIDGHRDFDYVVAEIAREFCNDVLPPFSQLTT